MSEVGLSVWWQKVLWVFVWSAGLLGACAQAPAVIGEKALPEETKGRGGAFAAMNLSPGIKVAGTSVAPGDIARGYNTARGLFVGINKYKQKDIQLDYAVPDATALHRQLLPIMAESSLLTDEKATRENILGQLEKYMNQSKPGDLLVVYIAAHGLLRYKDFYLLGRNTDTSNLLGTGIPSSSMINALTEHIRKGLHVLLVFDTCHSGGVGFDVSDFYSSSITPGSAGGSGALLVSAQPNEVALEGQEFGKGHGAFTHFLVRGLQGHADKNRDKIVTLREAYSYLYVEVNKATKGAQNPVLLSALSNTLMLSDLRSPQEVKPVAPGSSLTR